MRARDFGGRQVVEWAWRQVGGGCAALLAVVALTSGPIASAASYTWSGGGAGTWSTAATNWTGAAGTPWDGTTGPTNVAAFSTAGDSAALLESVYASQILFASPASITGSGTITLTTGSVAVSSTAAATTVSAAFTGTAPLIKTGAGTLVLTGSNTYTGTTAIAAGTLQLAGGANRIAGGVLSFTGSNTVLDVTNTAQTFSAMTFVQPTSGTAAMTISGAGGSVTVNGSANFEVGPLNCTTAGIADALSMANLSSFTYSNPAGTFRVGLRSSSTNSAVAGTSSIVLAQSNAITAATIGVADVQANTNGGRAQLLLGQTNAFNVTTITQGSNRSDSQIAFQAGLTSPALVIRGTNGTSPMGTWTVGQVAQTTTGSQNFVATVDLSAGTVDAAVTTLTIGQANCVSTARSGVQRSSFTMGSGTLAAGTIMVGRMSGGSGVNGIGGTYGAYGALVIGNPGAVVSATNVYVAENTFSGTIASAATATVSGTIRLSAGTLRAVNLSRGTQTGVSAVSVNPTVVWTGGTIGHLPGSNLAVTALPLTLSSGTGTFLADAGSTITVNSASPISGGGRLVKAGAGAVVLEAANTYTGPTAISAGTLALGAAGSIASSSTVSLASGAVLDASAVAGGYAIPGTQALAGAGAVAGGLTVGGSAAVIPAAGTGPLTVTGGLTLAAGGSYDWQMLDATGTAGTGWGLISTDSVSFSGLSSASPFHVNVWSLSSASPVTGGDAANFDSSLAGSWRILTAASTITGFDPANFTVTTSAVGASTGFTNTLLGGTFSLALSGDGLGLDAVFTPYVPYSWYGNGATAGGGGTWSSAGLTWNGGSGIVAWDPAKGALFGTSGGTVTLSGPQSVGYGISFTADGYTLTGDALSLTGDQAGNTVTVTNGATATLATALTATGGMTKSGGGTLVLAGDSAAAGGVKLSMGALAVGAGGTTGGLTGDVATVVNTTLTFNRSDDSTYAGSVSGAGGLRKAGGGTLTLTGANSHTGGTVLAGGTVALGSADALGSSGTIALVGGAIQYSAANTTDYSARISTGTGQAFTIDTNGQNVSFATGLAGAGNPLTKHGAGTLVLSGSGSFTGPTRIVAGTLDLANVGALAGSMLDMNAADAGTLMLSLTGTTYSIGGLKGSRDIDLATNTLAAGSIGESTTYDGVISGAGGFTKTGTGTMVLTATQAYLGTTAVNGGTLRVSLPNQLASTGTLSLGGSGVIVDIGSTTQTLATMTTGNGGAFTNMAVTGSGGALAFTGPGNFEVGPGGTVTAGQQAQVSLAGIASLSYAVPDGTFRVGLKGTSSQNGATGTSSLTLATSNTIVSGTLGLGDIGGNNDGGGAQLSLGQTNDIRTSYVSMSASRADSLLQFAPGTTAPTLVLRGTDGSGPTGTWLVGSVGQFNSASRKTFTATVDLSSGTTDAAVNWLVIGQANCSGAGRGGSMRSSFTMGAGTLATGSITVGRITGGSATTGVSGAFGGYGALVIAHPAALVTATSIYVAENTITGTGSATKTVSGTIALSAGTLRAGTLARGEQTGLANVVTTTFLWTGGTIGNLPGSDLTIDTLPLTLSSGTGTFLVDAGRTITVNAASPMSGGGGLVKAGDGTLELAAANLYTGATTISAGTLRLASGANRLAAGSAVTVASGGVLDLGGNAQSLGALTGLGSVSTGGGGLTVGAGDASATFDGIISGLGGLTKVGSGIYVLTGSNSYTGPTAVNGGSLLVDGTLGATAVTVSAGGLLGGSGSLLGGVSVVGGTLAPGGAPGTLTVGSLSLDAASTTRIEITGATAGQYDQIAVSGSLAYGGTLTLDISQILADSSTLNLFPGFPSFSGNLSSVTSVGAAYNGVTFSRSGDVWTSTQVGGQTLEFSQATGTLMAVPEPASLAAVGLAAVVALAAIRRRGAEPPV